MPPPIDALLASLQRNGVSTGADLRRELGVTQPTLSRLLSRAGDRVLRIGGGRSTRYAVRRPVPEVGSSWPLFCVSPEGEPRLLGRLHALARDQYWLDERLDHVPQLSDGLPFYLQDLIPQGFIGRTVPRRYPELGLPERILDWNDDHVLQYLCRRGENCIGNLILGDESLQRFLTELDRQQAMLDVDERAHRYPTLAEAAIAGTVPGSSAGGEHPKFTATIRQGDRIQHVLVKFSPERRDAIAERWSDLLVSEHLASRVLARASLTPEPSRLLIAGNRTFLESTRFDRTGTRGRIGVVTLAALSNVHLGRRDDWTTATRRLAEIGVIDRPSAQAVRRLATFGKLIGNTDMHFGNVSFYLHFDRQLTLAPVYDMLPMLYAPTANEVRPLHDYAPPVPDSDTLDIWGEMTALGEAYWQEVASHDSVSPAFRAQAARNATRLAAAGRLTA